MNSVAPARALPDARPIRPGLFQERPNAEPVLIGSRCSQTGEVFWPAEVVNPRTHRAGTMESVEIDGRGKLVSYAVVQRGLPGFASPYAIASIALDAGPTLIAQLEGWEETRLTLGMPLRLSIGVVRTDKDGAQIVGPKFRPEAASDPAR